MKIKQSTIFIFLFLSISAQNKEPSLTPSGSEPDKITVDLSGMTRLDTFFDIRQGLESPDGSAYLFPLKRYCDDQGGDINNRGSLGFTPGVTRLDVTITTPKINTINLSGLMEVDVFGFCTTSLGFARLRLAYLKAHSPKSSLLVGYYWHPIYPMDCHASTVNLHGGTPIEIYNRYPQIRFHYYPSSLGFIFTIYSDFQYPNMGPYWFSPQYMQNTMTPGLYGAVEIKKENFFMGAGINMQRILPELSTTTTTTPIKTYASNEKLTSFIGTLYCSFDINECIIKNKIIVGQNGFPFGGFGGYAVSCVNAQTGQRNFTNINFASYWGEISYHHYKKMQPGIFFGITKNLGSHKKPVYLNEEGKPTFYGWDSEFNQLLRISPRIWSRFNNMQFGIELSYTRALYGKMNQCGKQPSTYAVSNLRSLAVLMYFF